MLNKWVPLLLTGSSDCPWKNWFVPLSHLHSETLRGASSVCGYVCLITKPCVKWRGKSLLLLPPTSQRYTDCTLGNWPGRAESITVERSREKWGRNKVKEKKWGTNIKSPGEIKKELRDKACGRSWEEEDNKEERWVVTWESSQTLLDLSLQSWRTSLGLAWWKLELLVHQNHQHLPNLFHQWDWWTLLWTLLLILSGREFQCYLLVFRGISIICFGVFFFNLGSRVCFCTLLLFFI